jgi:nitroreductase
MTIQDAILSRHSVRQYSNRPLTDIQTAALRQQIAESNTAKNLHMQLVVNEPKALSGLLSKFLRFSGAMNYIAMVGMQSPRLHEDLGYEGEKLVLLAQTLGLNTCWVGGSFSRNRNVQVGRDEMYVAVIAIGHGLTQGKQHPSKPITSLADIDGTPDWFRKGVECAMLAPSAMNRQNFHFTLLSDNKVKATTKPAPFSGMDLGIAKLHFELGAGKENFVFA